MKYLTAFIVFVFALSSAPQQNENPKPIPCAATKIPTVAYCDLIRNPELYDQKVIRVKAIYRYGYEWSELYCGDCLKEGQTWVDFDESFESCTKPDVAKKLGDNGFKGRTVSVVMIGKFHGSGGGYGHMNAYRFRLLVSCVEQAKIILNDSPVPTAIPKSLLSSSTCLAPLVENKSEGHQQ
jgi:hypothetical protein